MRRWMLWTVAAFVVVIVAWLLFGGLLVEEADASPMVPRTEQEVRETFRAVEVAGGTRVTYRAAAQTWVKSEKLGRCLQHRLTGANMVCLWQRVTWKYGYDFARHRAYWVSVVWDRWQTRDSSLTNWWYFKSWDGAENTSGSYPSAGENLQWKARKQLASFEYCVLDVGCIDTAQLWVRQHVENFGNGGYTWATGP